MVFPLMYLQEINMQWNNSYMCIVYTFSGYNMKKISEMLILSILMTSVFAIPISAAIYTAPSRLFFGEPPSVFDLRDYNGARDDLQQLIEQYPDTEIFGKAYLRLADATKLAGLNPQAAQLYQRVYNFELFCNL